MSDLLSPGYGVVRLYHPSGPAVTLPVPADPAATIDYELALHAVSAALDAGWLAEVPGLEAGEQKEEIGWVLTREKTNQDGDTTPIVDLYPANERMTWKMLSVYLNTNADKKAFEIASGLKLLKMEPFPGAAAPERGANRQSDRMIYKAPKPFMVILKDNPRYNPDEPDAKKRKPKRIFVRWDNQAATPEPVIDEGKLLADFEAFIASDPPLDEFNEYLHTTFVELPDTAKERTRGPLAAHAKACGWVWSTNCYVSPSTNPGF